MEVERDPGSVRRMHVGAGAVFLSSGGSATLTVTVLPLVECEVGGVCRFGRYVET